MKTVLRLVWSYFTATRVTVAFTLAGVAMLAVAAFVLTTRAQSFEMSALAFAGLLALFLGSSMMPLTFGRLARSHLIGVLPFARVKLLASAFITTLIVSVPVAALIPFLYVAGVSGGPADLVKHPQLLDFTLWLAAATFTSIFIIVGWLYVFMWFVTSQRNVMGSVKGMLLIVLIVFAPVREIHEIDATVTWHLEQIAIIWVLFGTGFLLWPRYRAALARRGVSRLVDLGGRRDARVTGREIDLILGTANPWLLIAIQVAPILIASRAGQDSPAVWLYFLTILSTVAGAIAGQAATRSRALWLRGDWSRAALFAQVERSFWRHNGLVLGSMMVFMVGVGSIAGLPAMLLAMGLPLLMLGMLLSTYLGLMVTRGLGWVESALGVGVMLALMTGALLAALDEIDPAVVFALEGLLGALALLLRFIARRRWTRIDWMLCQRDRALTAREA